MIWLAVVSSLLLLAEELLGCLGIPEPFDELTGKPVGEKQPLSPDPLVNYLWNNPSQQLEIIAIDRPVEVISSPKWILDHKKNGEIVINGKGSIRFDWGVERAAWFELFSDDMCNRTNFISGSISEYDQPYTRKRKRFKAYKNCSAFRLETNNELYEGVRFTWIYSDTEMAISIKKARLVAQVKPLNYGSSFHSSDDVLTRCWYTGAYGVRLNTKSHSFSSILMDRGDRVSIQGDGFPTMATALTSFPSQQMNDLVFEMIKMTDSACIGCKVIDSDILAYPVYWTLSVNRWYMQTGDSRFVDFIDDICKILDTRVKYFAESRTPLVWMGWDDRLGNGWCGNDCGKEAELAFDTLLLFAINEFSVSLQHTNFSRIADKYSMLYNSLLAKFRNGSSWINDLGLHAGSNALLAGVLSSADEKTRLVKRIYTDLVTVCSWSPFNQYFVLSGMSRANFGKDRAIEMIKYCWAPMMDYSNGCFWELFSPEWPKIMSINGKPPTTPSLCHPWSSGITTWLSETILGIIPTVPGFDSFVVLPHLSFKHRYVNGTFATNKGYIVVHAAYHNCSFYVIKVKNPTSAMIGVPYDSLCSAKYEFRLNEARVKILKTRINGILYSTTNLLKSGKHKLEIQRKGECCERKESLFPEISYRRYGYLDRGTKGNWKSAGYGDVGFALFGFHAGNDLKSIPEGSPLKNISIFRDIYTRTFIGSSYTIKRFLENPKRGYRRALGYVSSGGDGSQGIVVNIYMPKGLEFKAAVYMVGNEHDASQAIRVLDGDSLDVIAPTPLIKWFSGGVYYVVQYNNSIRFRIMPINGTNTVSAVFVSLASSTQNIKAKY